MFIFLFPGFISAVFSPFFPTSFKSLILAFLIISNGLLLSMNFEWPAKGLKYILIFSYIHVFFTLLAYFIPSIYLKVLRVLPSDVSDVALEFFHINLYAGITNQIGTNAIFITFGLSVIFSLLLISSTKQQYIIRITVLSLGFLALLLTGKRAPLLFNIVSILIVIFSHSYLKNKSFIRNGFFYFVIFLALVLCFAFIFPETNATFNRTLQGLEGGDVLSGRIPLYQKALVLFLEKPYWGWGWGFFATIYEIGTHSIYMQLLCEGGTFGFLAFFIFVLFNGLYTIRLISFMKNVNSNIISYYIYFSVYNQVFFLLYGLSGNPLGEASFFSMYMISVSVTWTMQLVSKRISRAQCLLRPAGSSVFPEH